MAPSGLTSTVFYLSGSSTEGVSAFSLTGSAPTFAANRTNVANSALVLASGSYLNALGSNSPPLLRDLATSAFSAAAWVKCAAPSNTYALSAVLEWGATGDAAGSAAPNTLALVVGGTAPAPNSGVVTTIAGSAGGTGTNAQFDAPFGAVAIPSSSVLVVADATNHRIRLLDVSSGAVTTLAGSSPSGTTDATGASAAFYGPQGVAVISSSNVVVVADTANNRIRLITYPGGVVTTLAGNSTSSYSDGTGTNAMFSGPKGVAVTSGGVIVVADSGNNCIRLVDPTSGVVSTLAGLCDATAGSGTNDGAGTDAKFSSPNGISWNPVSSTIVVADTNNNRIRLVTYPGGVVSTLAGNAADTVFSGPTGVSVIPSSGVIVVSDSFNYLIRLVTPLGVVTTLAGNSGSGSGSSSTDGTGASATFAVPRGIAVLPLSGAIAVVDQLSSRIRLITLPLVVPACDSTWHHAALTYSSSASPYKLSLFLDGALVLASASTITLPSISASPTLRIGWNGDLANNGGSLFVGSVSNLRIYSSALSAANVATLAAY